MKIQTIKLREAHKSENGESSFCSILWDPNGQHIVTASSADNSICIHDALLPSNTPKILRNHKEGVTALAISPNSTCLASGSIDHSVKLYKFPGGDFEANITRFTLPIRTLCFNKSGTMLAAAGDDEGIKLVNTVDGTIARVLKGHKGSITSLAFDPKIEYLASLDSVGTVIFWELQSGNTIHVLKGLAPNHGSDISVMNILGWSPDGEMLAVPGLKNDVVMYDRDTAEKLFSLRGDHFEPICFLCWSPNGKYMATSSVDKQVFIWDVDKKQDIERQKFNDSISCMAWKPHGNALAVIDNMGKYGLWEFVVPSSMKSPTEDVPSLRSSGFVLFDNEEEPVASGSLSDLNEDSHGESELTSRKRLRKRSIYDDDWEEDVSNELESTRKVESRKKPSHGHKNDLNNAKNGVKNSMATSEVKMQEAFQPGATPLQPGKRHFLCYNMLGSITSMAHDGYSHIEIDFHDTSTGPRIPAMSDHFGFTMAALSENGSVFANPGKGEKNMSTLMYRPFRTWANNSEWSMRFEDEEVRAVALGNGWVASVTSLNFLRIFTEGGLQRYIVSLDGPVVTAVGLKNELAIVTHASPSLPSEDQMLEVRVLNIHNGTQSHRRRLPLTPGSYLTWFGFSEEGLLSSFDSKGVLRVFTNQLGGSWMPLFRASKQGKAGESYWVVGLNANKLFSIVCKSPEAYPQATPKPILTLLNLSFPLASSDLGADSLENEFMMNNMHLSQIQKRIEEMVATGQYDTSLDDEAFNLEASLDRCILRLIASCCNGDKLVRATELVKLLSLEKSIRGAIKLVTALKLPNLAERFSNILEERLSSETVVKTAVPQMTSNDDDTMKTANAVDKSFTTPESSKTSDKTEALSTSSFFAKKGVAKEPLKNENEKVEVSRTTKLEKTVDVKNAANLKDAKEVKSVEEAKKMNNVVTSSRPSNPFAKSSSKPENTSLFDCLKSMKKADTKGKR